MTEGYGLAEKAHEDLVWWADTDAADALEAAIIDIIRAADTHTGILGGQGHLGCRLCVAVKELRRLYGLE